jgi:hypothetical protein
MVSKWGYTEMRTEEDFEHAPGESLVKKTGRTYTLPHQCDYWEIGDKEDVRALVTDLLKAINEQPPFDFTRWADSQDSNP